LNFEAVFIQWIKDYEKLIRHLIVGFEAKPAIQDELYQDITLNIWRALPKFRRDASVKTFVARIAHNILATHVAKSVRTVKADRDIESIVDTDNEQMSSEATPYQVLTLQQRQQFLLQAIRQLTLEQQQVITLALEGMTYQEIAEILSITTSLVGVRLQRAKTALAKLLEAQ